ncbi:MAG: RNA polymerase sigma factor [Janthinobacterium lividum]
MQDNALLIQYTQNHSEAAFAQLFARHLPLVYRTCRRELGSEALAEDAAQVVFLLLARKAKSLHAGPSLAGWLYQTSVFVAKDIRKQEARRTRREEAAMQEAVHTQFAPSPEWEAVEPLLNAALSALKPSDREAVLLRFLEGHTLAETGTLLGVSEDAARMRVTRALEKLRHYLTAHGAVVTGTILVALLTAEAARPISAEVASVVTQGTLQALSSGPAPNILLLTKGVSHTMKILKIKYATLGAALLLAGASVPPLVHALSLHTATVKKAGVKKARMIKASVETIAAAIPLPPNVTQTFTLSKDRHAFFSATLPQGASTVVLDMRRADTQQGSTTVSVNFTRNSALHNSALHKTKSVGEVAMGSLLDTESRMIVRSALNRPIPVVVDVYNKGVTCHYWLTTLKTVPSVKVSSSQASPALAFPMFGDIVPKPMALGETETGRLEKNGHAYFRVALKAGRYQSLLHFSRVNGNIANPSPVDGELTLSDESGYALLSDKGSPVTVGSSSPFFKDINELHASASPNQDAAKFELKQDGVFLVTLSNQASSPTADDSSPVYFTEQIVPDNSPFPIAKQN